MAAERREVECANQEDGRITGIGGINPDKTRWSRTEAEAIKEMDDKISEFYVDVDEEEVEVIVIDEDDGNRYLRTEGDDSTDNNLLSLPPCP